jgi:hypothetical protein
VCGVDVRAAAPATPFTRTDWPEDDDCVVGGDVGCGTTAGDVMRDWNGDDGEFDGRDYKTDISDNEKKRLPNSEMQIATVAIHYRRCLNKSAFKKFSSVSISVCDVQYEFEKTVNIVRKKLTL